MNYEIDIYQINLVSVSLRLLLATICGGLIGVERTKKQRAAGFRTHILVCIGSTLAMMTNQYIVEVFGGTGDPSRIGAQVISGVGFLGAGTILVTRRQEIKGLTTAAGLWASACMGLAIGIGFYEGAVVGFVYIFGVMTILQKVDQLFYRKAKIVNLYIEIEDIIYFQNVLTHFKVSHQQVYETQVITSKNALTSSVGILIGVKLRNRRDESDIVSEIKGLEGVKVVEEV